MLGRPGFTQTIPAFPGTRQIGIKNVECVGKLDDHPVAKSNPLLRLLPSRPPHLDGPGVALPRSRTATCVLRGRFRRFGGEVGRGLNKVGHCCGRWLVTMTTDTITATPTSTAAMMRISQTLMPNMGSPRN
jgi:hypothetical protein